MAHLSVLELISDLSRGLELNWEEALDRCVGGAEVKLWRYTEYEGASYIQYKGTTSFYSYDLPIQPLQYVGATSFYSYDLPIQPLQYQAMTLHTKVLV